MDRKVVRFGLILVAVALGSTIGATTLLLLSAKLRSAPAPPPLDVIIDTGSIEATGTSVRTEMRNVRYHLDPDITLHIRHIRGLMIPVDSSQPPVLEDGRTYSLGINSAEITIDTADLGRLLNRYVFGYPGAPIRDIHVSTEGQTLIQRGKLGTVSFTIRSTISTTDRGEIRLSPEKVKVLGISVGGLMRLFGLTLEKILTVRPEFGMRIDGNDLLLNPTAALPPPKIRGRLTEVRITPGGIIQYFGRLDPVPARSYFGATAPATNFMYYVGGNLRFGKLLMTGADLLIVDADPGDPFEFLLRRYHEQLVAGHHRTTEVEGLVVEMPDVDDLDAERASR